MKKIGIAVVLLAVATSGFAIDLSAGVASTLGGFSSTARFEPYIIVPAFPIWTYDSRTEHTTNVPFGISLYFDATYGFAAVGFRVYGEGEMETISVDGASTDSQTDPVDERAGFFSLTLFGRYPFALGPVTVFPLLGVEYDLNLYLKAADGTDLKAALPEEERPWLHQFWFKGGAGADIDLVGGLYVRPLVLLGFKVLDQGEKNHEQDAIDTFGATTTRTTDFVLEAGLQAGWRF